MNPASMTTLAASASLASDLSALANGRIDVTLAGLNCKQAAFPSSFPGI